MTGIKFCEMTILSILDEAKTGKPISDICLKYRICPDTFYQWEKHYQNVATTASHHNKLEEINRKFKKLYDQVHIENILCHEIMK